MFLRVSNQLTMESEHECLTVLFGPSMIKLILYSTTKIVTFLFIVCDRFVNELLLQLEKQY